PALDHTLSLHDALPISLERIYQNYNLPVAANVVALSKLLVPLNISVLPANYIPQPYHDFLATAKFDFQLSPTHSAFFRFAGEKRSEEHTSELQSPYDLV